MPSLASDDYYLQVRGGQLWGTDVYTYDSDLVAGKSYYRKGPSFFFANDWS